MRQKLEPWRVLLRLGSLSRLIATIVLAYVIALQGLALGVAHARALGKAFDARSGFDPMMSLCLTAKAAEEGDRGQSPGDDHHRGLCCILCKTIVLMTPVLAIIAVLDPAATQVLSFHPPRHVIPLAIGPPKAPEARGPPVSI